MSTSAPTLAPHQNRLAHETSPYLLQHKDNPVEWWAWGPEALGRRQALQQADPAVRRLCGLSLVPRDGARKLRGRRHRERDERAVRQHQSGSRGAARHRSDLHGGAASPRRARRLAADHVSHAHGRADLGRHIFSQNLALRRSPRSRMCCARSRACFARSRKRSSTTAPL